MSFWHDIHKYGAVQMISLANVTAISWRRVEFWAGFASISLSMIGSIFVPFTWDSHWI